MREQRKQRLDAAVAKLAAAFISRTAHSENNLITVTRASIADDGKEATVFVTVLPETQQEQALAFLERHRREFRAYLAENLKVKHPPRITFSLDAGEKNRQRIDTLGEDEETAA